MHTDKLFHEYFQLAPQAIFELARIVPACAYRYESPVVKASERRLDGFLEPLEPGHPHYFVEVQGYRDPSIYWRSLGQIGIFHQKRSDLHRREWRLLIFFLDASFDPGPQTLGTIYPGRRSWLTRGVLPNLLQRVANPSPVLNVLRPLTAPTITTVQRQGSKWVDGIRQAADFDEYTQTRLLTLLVQFVAQRFVHLPRKEIDRMLKLTPFEETTAGKEYIQEGIQRAMREDTLAILEERLGPPSLAIAARVKQVSELGVLQKLLRRAATVESLHAFEQFLATQFQAN